MNITLRSLALAAVLAVPALFGADAGLMNLIPAEAKVVAGIDISRAKSSPFGQMILRRVATNDADLAKLSALTGFDPRRDLTEVIVAADSGASKKSHGLILARGVFDLSKIRGAMLANGGLVAATVDGIDIYTKKGDDGGIAFLDSGLAVGGDVTMVKAVIARRGGSAGSALDSGLYAKAQEVSRSNDLWLVSSAPVSSLAEQIPQGTPGSGDVSGMMKGDAFQSVEQAIVGVQFASELVNLSIEAVAKTEKDATAMADVVKFLASMVQMNRDKPAVTALATALDGMKLSTDARTTRLSLSLPQADLERMFDKATVRRSTPAVKKIRSVVR